MVKKSRYLLVQLRAARGYEAGFARWGNIDTWWGAPAGGWGAPSVCAAYPEFLSAIPHMPSIPYSHPALRFTLPYELLSKTSLYKMYS